MKKLITLSVSLFCLISGFAQSGDDYYAPVPSQPKLLSKERVSTSISAGTGIGFMNGSTSFTTFVAPKINYQLSNRFRLNAGFIHYTASRNSTLLLNRNEAILNSSSHDVSGNLVIIGGDYLLNKKTILSGSVMTDVNSFSRKNESYKAASLGIEYRISDHSSIKLETVISNGQGNYYNNPSTGSSFSTNLFDTGFPPAFNSSFR